MSIDAIGILILYILMIRGKRLYNIIGLYTPTIIIIILYVHIIILKPE